MKKQIYLMPDPDGNEGDENTDLTGGTLPVEDPDENA